MRICLINIEGNVATLKSTILSRVHRSAPKEMYVKIIPEPVPLWLQTGLFQNFRKQPHIYAACFQAFAATTLFTELFQAIKQSQMLSKQPKPVVLVQERSLHTSQSIFTRRLAEQGFLTKQEEKTLQEINDIYQKTINRDAADNDISICRKNILIRAPIKEIKRRIQERAREGEENIDEEELKQLAEDLESWRESFGGADWKEIRTEDVVGTAVFWIHEMAKNPEGTPHIILSQEDRP